VILSTTIVNCRFDDYDIYVGRPSMWGNPFSHTKSRHAAYEVADREESIRRYADHLRSEPVLLDIIVNLEGKVLGCWCRPRDGFAGRLMCHAQIIVGLIHDVDPLEVP